MLICIFTYKDDFVSKYKMLCLLTRAYSKISRTIKLSFREIFTSLYPVMSHLKTSMYVQCGINPIPAVRRRRGAVGARSRRHASSPVPARHARHAHDPLPPLPTQHPPTPSGDRSLTPHSRRRPSLNI